jgi:DNA-binding MarR family transcriptional regulator
MTKLTELQTALIEQASERADGALLPAPESGPATGTALNRALEGLVRKGLATRTATSTEDGGEVWSFVLTDAGRAAVAAEEVTPTEDAAQPPSQRPAAPGGKLGVLLKAIGRKQGATLAELTAATGWQAHTTRAALTRLRQRGFPAALTEDRGRKAYRLRG